MTDNLLPNQDMTVSTDKADYAPGETVKITASGFAKDSTIQFEIKDDPNDPGDDGEADVYKPFSITDGGAGDLDGIANGQVLAAWGVPTDNNGTGSGTPDALNGTLNLTATGSDGQAAMTTFTDAAPTGNVDKNYQHWADGDAVQGTTADWNNNILSDNKSDYFEGEVIPHVYVVQSSNQTPLVNGQTYFFDIIYNFYNTSGNASGFDYVTTYNISRSPTLLPDASGQIPVIDNSFTGTGNQGAFYTIDADIISATGPTYSSLTGTRDGIVKVTFQYTGPTSGGANGNQIAEIYYGLHIAQPGGAAPGTNGASVYPGGSLQTTIDNTPFSGALSLQLNPSAVEQGVISGVKFNDLNGNGIKDSDEAALAGWTIYLDTNNNGTLDSGEKSVVTSNGLQDVNNDGIIDPLGTYIFNVTPDSNKSTSTNDPYIVREVQQAGWTQTAPAAGFYSDLITAANPQFLNQNFGNQESNPAIEVIKTTGAITDVDNNGQDAGDTVNYTYKVTNTGNVTLNPVTLVDDNGTPLNTADNVTITLTDNNLAPGEVGTGSYLYALTQADIDAGFHANTALATGKPPIGDPVTDDNTQTVNLTQKPKIEVIKTAGAITDVDNNGQDAGDTVNYTYKVTNTGNVTLNPVTLVDDNGTPLNTADNVTITLTDNNLAPGEVGTGSYLYTLTQADIDAGFHANTALATGKPPIGDPVTDDNTQTVNLTQKPKIEVIKTAGAITDVDNNGQDAGDTVNYTYKVTNTGNVTLNPVTLVDDNGTPLNTADNVTITLTDNNLAPGEVGTGSYLYTLTQADIDAGFHANIALATGKPPIGDPVTDDNTQTVNLTQKPKIEVIKTAGAITDVDNNGQDAGDTVNYTYKVTNTGNVTLNPVTLVDDNGTPLNTADNVTITLTDNNLAPGEVGTGSYLYTLTQADIDAGFHANTALATGKPPIGDPVTDDNTQTVNLTQKPKIEVIKTAGAITDVDNNGQDAGDTVNYTYKVTNTGNVTLNPVTLVDDNGTPLNTADNVTITLTDNNLAPGEVGTGSYLYTLTQADIDAGFHANIALATGKPPIGDPVTDDNTQTVNLTQKPKIEVIKTTGAITDVDNNGQDAGDTVNYTYKVTNTGNVTLNPVTLVDDNGTPLNTADNVTITLTDNNLAPGEVGTGSYLYTLTQADIDAGFHANIALATGKPPIGDPVTDDNTQTVNLTQKPKIEVIKTAGAITDVDNNGQDAGDTVNYTYKVTNTGNVTLNPVTLVDDNGTPLNTADNVTITLTDNNLAPGEVGTGSYLYTLTQADIDAGFHANTALATGKPPIGDPVTDDNTQTVNLTQKPKIEVIKTAGAITDVDNNGQDAGDTVNYTYKVTNTGNVTLNPVTLVDDNGTPLNTADNVTITLTDNNLAPGEVGTGSYLYTLTQADIDAGFHANIALATGKPPIGDPVTDDNTQTVNLTQKPKIEVIKTAGAITDVDNNGQDAGDTVNYTYKVTNTGNVTLNPVTLVDDNGTPLNTADNVTITLTDNNLAPGEVGTGSYLYTLTQADIDAGFHANTALATGKPPIGDPVTDDNTQTVNLTQKPKIEVIKTAGAITDVDNNGQDAGDTVNYTYKVTNTGNVTLNPVTLVDDNGTPLNTADNVTITLTDNNLAPGEVGTGSYLYTLTQADIDAGFHANIALATGKPPIGDPVTDDNTQTVNLTQKPKIEVIKTTGAITDVDNNGQDAGDTVNYTYKVTNTGNVTLNPVTLVDDNGTPLNTADNVTITLTDNNLAPGEVGTGSYLYTLTQADIDAGFHANIALATGKPPIGDPVTDDNTQTVNLTQKPKIEVIKTAGAITDVDNNGQDAGDTVNYTYKVTNTGNVTLNPVTLVDDNGTPLNTADNVTITLTDNNLAPGEVGTGSYLYTLTQADIDAGFHANTALATGKPPIGDPVTDDNTQTVNLTQKPKIEVIKTAGAITDVDNNGQDAGDTVNYTYKVTNTGNVTLNPVTLVDDNGTPLNTADNVTITLTDNNLAPGEVGTGSYLYTLTQADIDAGFHANIALATGKPPIGDPVTDDNTQTVNLTQKPKIEVIKTAGAITDVDNNGQDAGDTVNYTYKVTNTGNVTLNPVTLVDDNGTPLNTADNVTITLTDNNLAPGEVGTGSYLYTLTQADIDAGFHANIALATGKPPIGDPVTDDNTQTVNLTQKPKIEVIKTTGAITDVDNNGQDAGDTVNYTYKVTNTGNVTLNPVTLVDDNGTPLNTADNVTITLTDNNLAPGEVGTGSYLYTLTQADIDAGFHANIALATGTTPGGDPVTGTDTNTVNLTRTGDLKITKTDYLTKVVPGQCVTYTIVVSNCGPDTATHALVEDLFPSNLTDVKWTSKAAKGATDNKARGTDNIEDYVTLPAGSSITYKVTGTVVGGPASHKVSDCHRTLTNTATVTAPSDFTDTNLENNTATDIDTIMAASGVRNAHFWQNTKWQKSWDGIQGNEHSQKTRPNFPDSDLLLSPYTNSARSGKVLDPITRRYGVGLLIGDYNHNGKTDKKENTLFYTRAQALQIVDSSMHPNNRDTRYILGRDLVTSWLNYLAGNSIDTPNSKDQDARDYINEGIHWLQALTPDQNRDGKGDGYLQGLTGNETSNSRTPQILARSSYWKSGISSASNLPNSYKSNTDVLYPIDAGITIHTHLDNYNNNIF